jgi:hypothetical protein
MWGDEMFTVNDDNSIYVTRGDIVFFDVTAEDDGVKYKFQPGDVVRIKVYGRKDAESVVLQKDFPVTDICEKVDIYLTGEDTKFGEVISKPQDYWYEVELNPDSKPQTIIGYDEDGAKVFKLFPEGADIEAYEPTEEDIGFVDSELDMTSPRAIQNQAVARAFEKLKDGYERTNDAVTKLHFTPQMFGAIVDGEADDTKAIQDAIDAAKRVKGATVVLPAGVYRITSPLTVYSHTRLIGYGKRGLSNEGFSGTHIQYDGNPAMNIIQTEIDSSGKYGIEIKDLRVSGAAARGFSLVNVSECLMESVTVNGGCEVGVYFEGTISHLDNLYLVGNDVGLRMKDCHGVNVAHLNSWENSGAGIQITGNCANVHICDSWIENSAIGIQFFGSLVCYNCTIDTTSFTAGSTYPEARFISADYTGSSETSLLQELSVHSCVVKINNPKYGVYIDTPNYNTIAAFEECSFFTSNAYTYAIYSNNKYNRFILKNNICQDYNSATYPQFGGIGNKLQVNLLHAYTEVGCGQPLRLLPITGALENYSEGQIYFKNGRLNLTDGTKVNKIPIQGEAIYGVSVNDVTLPELAQKVNDLLVTLRNSNAIT